MRALALRSFLRGDSRVCRWDRRYDKVDSDEVPIGPTASSNISSSSLLTGPSPVVKLRLVKDRLEWYVIHYWYYQSAFLEWTLE